MRLLNSTASVGSSWTYTHVHVCVLYTVYITRNQLDSVELHICVKHMSFYCGEGTATPLPETLHDLSRRLTRLGGGMLCAGCPACGLATTNGTPIC